MEFLKSRNAIAFYVGYFLARCPRRKEICVTTIPPLTDIGKGHYVACHLEKK
jgi:hypothetical protein